MQRGATTDERPNDSPSREGQGPSGPGVGCGLGDEPTPALTCHPSLEGIFRRVTMQGSVKVREQGVGCVGDFANASSTQPDGRGFADRTREASYPTW